MPSSPPAVLHKSDAMRPSTPNREGTYPPTMEPTTIPNIISFFRDIVLSMMFLSARYCCEYIGNVGLGQKEKALVTRKIRFFSDGMKDIGMTV